MIKAARNLDYKKMAQDTYNYISGHKAITAGSSVGVASVGATGYIAQKAYVAGKAKATPVGLEDVRNLFEDAPQVEVTPVKVKTDENTAKAIKSAVEQLKADQVVQAIENIPSVEFYYGSY